MTKITIQSKDLRLELDVKALDNPTVKKINESLPLESKANLWGDEIYFDIGVTAPSSGATLDVNVGDIAYWPEGKCLCIFFGRTPASSGNKPVPASEVVIVGRAKINPDKLKKAKTGDKITVE